MKLLCRPYSAQCQSFILYYPFSFNSITCLKGPQCSSCCTFIFVYHCVSCHGYFSLTFKPKLLILDYFQQLKKNKVTQTCHSESTAEEVQSCFLKILQTFFKSWRHTDKTFFFIHTSLVCIHGNFQDALRFTTLS